MPCNVFSSDSPPREGLGEAFNEKFGTPQDADAETLTSFTRNLLRNKFKTPILALPEPIS